VKNVKRVQAQPRRCKFYQGESYLSILLFYIFFGCFIMRALNAMFNIYTSYDRPRALLLHLKRFIVTQRERVETSEGGTEKSVGLEMEFRKNEVRARC
jgi:hypothetical protein